MSKTILVCPLNWGLGHASRCIPVIREFLKRNCRVVVAASGAPLAMLRDEFGDDAEYMIFPGKEIKYSRGKFMILKLTGQLPGFLFSMYQEYRWIKKITKTLKPDIIISDNRYGARSRSVYSVFITHQLFVRMPPKLRIFQGLSEMINRMFIHAFHECWVPDFPDAPGLSDDLSHKKSINNVFFTGPLSRFQNPEEYKGEEFAFQLPDDFILVLLSGPEPQRSILEDKLSKELEHETVIWFRGLPGNIGLKKTGNHFRFDHGNEQLMGYCLKKARLVICRSGYSTIMDLAVFGKKAILIPTPGQTEQEYLAEMLHNQSYVVSVNQKNLFELHKDIPLAEKLKGIPQMGNSALLADYAGRVLKKV
ncbi:MAG: glycosyl transferase family 28 [Bacteroidetes bacterium]|nr:MAG: glycosyl transferase family 28 [Bacteroidota bacterium]